MAINRIRYDKLNVDYLRRVLADLEGDRAVEMGVLRKEGDGYVPTGLEFPRHVSDFKIFFNLLKQVCRIAIAEQDVKEVEREIEELAEKEKMAQIDALANQKRLELIKQVHSLNVIDTEAGNLGPAVENIAIELQRAQNDLTATLYGESVQPPASFDFNQNQNLVSEVPVEANE